MKKLFLLLVSLIAFINICYSSFPVFNSNFAKNQMATTLNIGEFLEQVAFFGTIYLLVRTIWRAYRRDVPWLKKLLRWKNIWWLLLLDTCLVHTQFICWRRGWWIDKDYFIK